MLSFCATAVFLAAFLLVTPIFSQTLYPGFGSPKTAMEVTLYQDAYLVNPTQGGTCNFGNIFGLQGIVLAPNTAMYSDDPLTLYIHDGQQGTPPTRGSSCGVCYNVTGPAGWDIVVSADICDGCPEFPGQGAAFILYDNPTLAHRAFRAVMGNTGAGTILAPTGVTWSKVSCPLNIFQGNGLGIRFLCWWFGRNQTSGLTTMASCEFTVLNHRTQIIYLQANVGDGRWQNLTRGWTNKWLGPIINWLNPYTLRIWAASGSPLDFTLSGSMMIDQTLNRSLDSSTGLEHGFPYQGFIYSQMQFPDFTPGQAAVNIAPGPDYAPYTILKSSSSPLSTAQSSLYAFAVILLSSI